MLLSGRAVDHRARRRGPERDDRHPPAGAHDHRGAAREQLCHPPAQAPGRRDQVHEREARHDQERLHHLGQEREARSARPTTEHPACRAALERPHEAVRRRDQQADEQRVGVVEAEHQRRDRRDREHRAGEQARRRRRTTASRSPSSRPTASTPSSDLGHEHARAREAEDPPGQRHHPQRRRRLVDRDEVRRVERAEEERLPALRAGLHGGRVEAVGVAGRGEVPQVGDRGGDEQPDEQPGAPTPGPRRARAPATRTVPPDLNRAGRAGRAGRGNVVVLISVSLRVEGQDSVGASLRRAPAEHPGRERDVARDRGGQVGEHEHRRLEQPRSGAGRGRAERSARRSVSPSASRNTTKPARCCRARRVAAADRRR